MRAFPSKLKDLVDWPERVRVAQEAWDKQFVEADETAQILMLPTSYAHLANGKTPFEATRQHFIRTYGPKFTERVLNDPRYLALLGLDKPEAHEKFVEPFETD